MKIEELFLYVSRIITILMGIIPGIFLSRIMNKEEYGTFLQIQLIAGFLTTALTTGVQKSIYNFSTTKDLILDKSIMQSISLLFILAIGTGFFLYIFLDKISLILNNNNLLNYVYPLIYLSFTRICTSAYPQIFIVKKEILTYCIIQILAPVITGISVIYLAYKGYDLIYLISIESFVLFFVLLILLFKNLNKFKNEFFFNSIDSIKHQIKFSAVLSLSSILSTFSRYAGHFAISSHFTPSQYALYSRGAIEIPLPNIITYSIASIMAPELVKSIHNKNINHFIKIYHIAITKAALFIVPVSLFFFISKVDVITLLYGEAFIDSAAVFGIYSLLLLTQICSFDVVVQSINKTKIVFLLSLIHLIITLSSTLIAIKYFMLTGPALAILIANSIIMLAYIIFISFALNLKLNNFFPIKQIILILFASTASTITFKLIYANLNFSNFQTLIISSFGFYVEYIAVILIFFKLGHINLSLSNDGSY